MTKKIGIWMDKREAKLIAIDENGTHLATIPSGLEEFNPKGGSGTRTKGGPQDVVQDSRYLEREKHQLKDYFQEVISNLSAVDALVVFGPAETGGKFADELSRSRKDLHGKLSAVEKADNMTDGQLKSWVKDYFS